MIDSQIEQILSTSPYIPSIEILGKGAFGVVYSGTNTKNLEKVAIKCIDKIVLISKQKNPDMKVMKQSLLEGETEIMRFLKHSDNPHIVKCYDVFDDNSFTIFVLEFCSGGTLYDYIETKQKLSEEETVQILRQLIYGFAGLHKMNIIHRDVKTDNILIKDGVFKIADFGLSTTVKKLTSNERKTQVGTRYTMAPQVSDGESYSAQADVWSLGVIIFEMLTGQFPFDSEILTDSAIAKANKSVAKLPIRSEFKKLLSSIFVKNPKERLQWKELYRMYSDKTGVFGIQSLELQTMLQKLGLTPKLMKFHLQKMRDNQKAAQKIENEIIHALWDDNKKQFLQNQKLIQNRQIQSNIIILVCTQIIRILNKSEEFIDLEMGGKAGKYCSLEKFYPEIRNTKLFLKRIYNTRMHLVNENLKIINEQILTKYFPYSCTPFQHIEKVKELKEQLLDIGCCKKSTNCFFCCWGSLDSTQLDEMSDFIDNQYYDRVMKHEKNDSK